MHPYFVTCSLLTQRSSVIRFLYLKDATALRTSSRGPGVIILVNSSKGIVEIRRSPFKEDSFPLKYSQQEHPYQ